MARRARIALLLLIAGCSKGGDAHDTNHNTVPVDTDPLVVCQGSGGVFHTDKITAIKEGMGFFCRVDKPNGTESVPTTGKPVVYP